MTTLEQYVPGPGSRELRLFWSARVDALDRHLSTDMWALATVTVALIAYLIARLVIPGVLQTVVPDVVRTVLHLI